MLQQNLEIMRNSLKKLQLVQFSKFNSKNSILNLCVITTKKTTTTKSSHDLESLDF